jgi:putative flippase GtrA
MNAAMEHLLDPRVRRFAMVGVANTVLGLALIFAGKAILGLNDVAANFAGYAIALLAGFALNKRWTFQHHGGTAAALGRYLTVLVAAYLANLSVTMWAIDALHLNSYWAQAAGVVPYAILGYLGCRFYAFHRECN